MNADDNTLGHGWRGSESAWIDAAYRALVSGGVDAVKIMPLARGLRLSRTSFYWHFPDREALLDALVRRWRDQNTGNLIHQTELAAGNISEAVLHLFDCWVTPDLFDARLDFAIRTWAQSNPTLRSVLAEADAERTDAIRLMFLRHGYSPDQADIRATTIYLTQMGYIALRTEESLARRLARIPTYLETFTGQPPDPAALAAFVDRHSARLDLQE